MTQSMVEQAERAFFAGDDEEKYQELQDLFKQIDSPELKKAMDGASASDGRKTSIRKSWNRRCRT